MKHTTSGLRADDAIIHAALELIKNSWHLPLKHTVIQAPEAREAVLSFLAELPGR